MNLLDYINQLKEAKQVGRIFHFTKLKSLESILKSGALSSNNGYISFTRNPFLSDRKMYQNDFTFINGEYNVRIELNGNKMSNKYKIEPYLDCFNDICRHQGENEERINKDTVEIFDFIEEIQILRNKQIVEKLRQLYPTIRIISVDNFKVK